ncbi:MAG TPA: hypothetical protein DGG95_13285 [Cytophagales bacterium]|nr:hypothetical protein [Cytophagales bacterium]
MNKIDQLFKNKLEDHSLAPSENAWAKVEAGLSKKNNIIVWRLAAAILLMGVLLTILIWSQYDTEKTPALAEKKIMNSKPKIEPQAKSSASIENEKQSTQQREVIQKHDQAIYKQVKEIPVEEKLTQIEKNNSKENETQIVSNDIPSEQIKIKPEEKIIVNATTKTEVASTPQKPMKLEFTLEGPSVETVATTSEVKNTGLKKVLEMAREIKQGEGPVFSLREKKDEFFAHSFISGKQKVQ